MFDSNINPIDLLEHIQQSGALEKLGEDRTSIESELDRLGEVSGTKLKDVWQQEVKSKKGIPSSKLDVIDDIMSVRFGKEYKKYLKGEVGEAKLKETGTESERSAIKVLIKNELQVDPDISTNDLFKAVLQGVNDSFRDKAKKIFREVYLEVVSSMVEVKESKSFAKKYKVTLLNKDTNKKRTVTITSITKETARRKAVSDYGSKNTQVVDVAELKNESKLKEMALTSTRYVIRAQAYDRDTRAASGRIRDEEIDIEKNDLFNGVLADYPEVTSIGDIEKNYEKFWDINKRSKEFVKVISIKPVTEESKLKESKLKECVCHIYGMSDKELLEFYKNMRQNYEKSGPASMKQYPTDQAEVILELQKRKIPFNEKEYDREKVPGTMQPQEEPEIDPEEQSMEPGDKEPDKKKQDTMTEVPDKELEQLIDKTNEDVVAMFAQDKVEILQKKVGELKSQADQLKKEQYGTKKTTRGYSLQQLYAKMDEYEKEIAKAKIVVGERKINETVQELIGETPGINQFDQKILNWAIEKEVIDNEFPPYRVMMEEISKHPRARKIDLGSVKDFSMIASRVDVQGIYLRYILLPKAKESFKKSHSEDKSWFERKQLYICNGCAKTFRNDVNECVHCKSKNVEVIGIKENDYTDISDEALITAYRNILIKRADFGGSRVSELSKELAKIMVEIKKRGLQDKVLGESKLKEQEKDMSFNEIKAETIAAIKNMGRNTNEWSVRDSLMKFTNWGFWKAGEMASIDIETANEIVKELLDYIQTTPQKQDVMDAYDIVNHYVPRTESKLKEQEEDNFKTIAKGIADKDTADKLASEKKGTVIQDEDDEEKFAVIVKESKLKEEDGREDLDRVVSYEIKMNALTDKVVTMMVVGYSRDDIVEWGVRNRYTEDQVTRTINIVRQASDWKEGTGESSKVDEDYKPKVMRSKMIDVMYDLGYSLSSERKEDGSRVLEFRKGSDVVEVKISLEEERD